MSTAARLAAGTATLGAAALGYAVGIERQHWTLREAELPVLAPGSKPIRVLHISDVHMLPGQKSKQRWIAALGEHEPDLVVNTGDNLAHPQAVPYVLRAYGSLLDRPGVFIFGSNDYYAPKPKNPARYLMPRGKKKRIHGRHLPWRDLRAAFIEHGWLDLTHTRRSLRIAGQPVFAAGIDDPHLRRDRYGEIAGPGDPDAVLRVGITHSPEPRILDPFAADGYDLVLAGHTHGGQLRIPGVGALVTNCELDRSRARGVSRWGAHMWLHVSAGLGTSPYAPARFACPPEASLLTLVPRSGPGPATAEETRRKAGSTVR
ncbi:metallophosphoesterase [Amycolatopsis alkalitolerans]|uniref:Metallophosphoesterase n=1 Tax=Amycolatopsis alkalitolerans TaxID=2547244 RepID=A0A5C4LV97_9PSEU|nr:metallophosphoesterase [Amycolatopsis alkalitolerans]TNC22948.1 metallophosphoesterase [Amycolatopsis alkalitolerans]